MGDRAVLPSTFTYGQTIEWIANSIGEFMSHDYLVREMWHLQNNDFQVEPAMNLIVNRLAWAKLDDPTPRESTMDAGEAVWEAQVHLSDALCDGRASMTGQPNWEPAHSVRTISKLECTILRFREDEHGVVTAAIKSDLRRFWSTIRFSSAEIEQEWPVLPPTASAPNSEKADENSLVPIEAQIPSAAVVEPEKRYRKRGPRGVLSKIITQAMRDALREGYDLAGALEKELPVKFGGKRTTCQKCRVAVLDENNSDNLRQITGNDK